MTNPSSSSLKRQRPYDAWGECFEPTFYFVYVFPPLLILWLFFERVFATIFSNCLLVMDKYVKVIYCVSSAIEVFKAGHF